MSNQEIFDKFQDCTICLEVFNNGEKVQIMPICKHIFHEHCCSKWLDFKFTCPNCNLPIDFRERQQQQQEAAPVVPAIQNNEVHAPRRYQINRDSSSEESLEDYQVRLQTRRRSFSSDEEHKEGFRIMMGDRFVYMEEDSLN